MPPPCFDTPPLNYAAFLTSFTRRWQAWPRSSHPGVLPAPVSGPDKREALEVIQAALAQHVSSQHIGLGLMLVRVVNLPMVSATYGVQRADELMRLVHERLTQALRKAHPEALMPGWVERLGEAECVVLTDAHVDPAAQRRLGTLLCETLNLALPLHETLIHVNAVVGLAPCDQAYADAQEMFQCANIALQAAESLGRGRLVVFERGMREGIVKQQLLASELNQALKGQQFELAFQPIIAVDTLAHRGFEALARWQHPARGCLLPRDFLDAAENAELICRLDLHIIALCLSTMADWQHRQLWKSGWFVSVNLSAQHFNQPGLTEQLQALVAHHAIAPQDLHLELTESAFMKNLVVARAEMTRLRQAGFDIYMDDFGTGYSSLSHLHELPFSAIKIDKCFLDPMVHNFEQTSLLSTMVHMAQLLGIKVVAEGLETLEQLSVLQGLQCEYAQGHLIRAAMGHEMASIWLQAALDPVV